MIIYIIFGILISILLIFFLNKLAHIAKKKFLFFFKSLVTIVLIVLFILLIRFNPQLIYGFPAFILFLFKWKNLILFFRKLLFTNNDQLKSRNTKMSKKQALEILGLTENVTRGEILKAYHDLLKKNHPDVGGSVWITSQLNKAKETLLG